MELSPHTHRSKRHTSGSKTWPPTQNPFFKKYRISGPTAGERFRRSDGNLIHKWLQRISQAWESLDSFTRASSCEAEVNTKSQGHSTFEGTTPLCRALVRDPCSQASHSCPHPFCQQTQALPGCYSNCPTALGQDQAIPAACPPSAPGGMLRAMSATQTRNERNTHVHLRHH